MIALESVERAVHVIEGGVVMIRRLVSYAVVAALSAITLAVPAVHAAAADKININTASVKELQKLDGVGHTVAERIVHYREEHGPFKRGEDLKKVEGVGAALWERNRERIVVK